tara:strand:+ start:1412 stop:2515 length:1104 start_codon:yes stop_codon:yes gene_type:complete
VKPAMKGSGVIVMVAPSTYNKATRSLAKQKGVQIRLTAEEIQANREGAGEMEGKGIFKKVFKAAKKVAKKAAPIVKKVAIAGARKAAPIAKKVAITAAKQAGRELAKQLPTLATAGFTAAALATGQPQLIPLAGIAGDKLGSFAGKELNKAIDKPSRYASFKKAREEIGRSALEEAKTEATSFGRAKIGEAKTSGKKYAKAKMAGEGGRSSKISDDFTESRKEIEKLKIKLAKMEDMETAYGRRSLLATRTRLKNKIERMEKDHSKMLREEREIAGIGLYAGRQGKGLYAGGGMEGEGLYAGRQGRGVASSVPNTPTAGLVGVNGNLLATNHPAFKSQAHSANFQFQHTMPPQLQMKGNIKGGGLYA